MTLPEFFAAAAEMKCPLVEIRDSQISPWSGPEKEAELKRLSCESGIGVEMITMRKAPLKTEDSYTIFLEYLDFAERIGARQIKVSSGNPSLARRAASAAAERKIMTGSNNHIGTVLETRRGTTDFFRAVGHDNFKLLFDPSHLWLNEDEADSEFIKKFAGKISYLVIQDYVVTDSPDGVRLGKRTVRPAERGETGAAGYPRIINTLEEAGVNAPFGLVVPGSLTFAL